MNEIAYVTGDATRPRGDGAKIICHVCNDIGNWGKGFVLAISKRWKGPETAFRNWCAAGEAGGFALGAVQFVDVGPDLWVANMIGQRGIKRAAAGPPIRYEAMASCLQHVAAKARELNASVHMPRIGCGLAGGDWSVVGALVAHYVAGAGVAVTVYDFE